MLAQNIKEAADFFNANWQNYINFVKENKMGHQEMLSVLNQFLHEHMKKRPFSFVDVGCGDSSTICPILLDNPIKKYIGIDIAEDVLKTAPIHLARLNCEKKFIFDNMTNAIASLQKPVDIIFSSHSVNHLPSYQQKYNFIYQCKDKLKPDGFFIMIDGILEENQNREQLLERVENTYKQLYPNISLEDLERLMNHHRSRVFPEYIHTFASISQLQGWKRFRVLFKFGPIVFIVLNK
jgi:2-polyprenyl-3-methyl-5-hydroxy-6-metoxy-1,4-benzoquinol methylase